MAAASSASLMLLIVSLDTFLAGCFLVAVGPDAGPTGLSCGSSRFRLNPWIALLTFASMLAFSSISLSRRMARYLHPTRHPSVARVPAPVNYNTTEPDQRAKGLGITTFIAPQWGAGPSLAPL